MYHLNKLEEPVRPKWRIRAYKFGGLGMFLAGSGLMAINPILGIALWTGSLIPISHSDTLQNEYEEKIEEYNNLKPHPTLDLYINDD